MSQTVLVMEDDDLFERAAELFVESAVEAVRDRGRFFVALAGGSTPKRLYSLLADGFKDRIPWDKVVVFFGDERCVPPGDPQSNYRTAEETLLGKVDIPRENIYRIKGELDPASAADEYARELVRVFGLGPGELPVFDLILLGMGDEGHTASIFPGSDVLHESTVLVASPYVEKLDSYRVTLTPPVLDNARRVVVLVTGGSKTDVLRQVLEGAYNPESYPAQILRNAGGEVIWLTDPSAASELKKAITSG